MLRRDQLLEAIAAMGGAVDYVRLAADVLGIRNAPPALARRLVEQALVVEDRREIWLAAGARIVRAAPEVPGVYVLRDAAGRAVYVGKANNIRRRLQTHFAARRWPRLRPEFVRATTAEWREVGSELEALLLEARWIRDLQPQANVQVGEPDQDARAVPSALLHDTVLLLPSVEPDAVEVFAVRVAGPVLQLRLARAGTGLPARVTRLRHFFTEPSSPSATAHGQEDVLPSHAPLVFSWLAGRGAGTTRLDPHDAASARELERRLRAVLADDALFAERLVVLRASPRRRR